MTPERASAPPDGVVVRARGLVKRYGAVEALRGIDVDVRAGEVLAVVGDNGAGKTTLIKLLAGVERTTAGEISIGGRTVDFHSAHDARAHGIETVHQTLALADSLSVWANMFLGRELRGRWPLGLFGWLSVGAMRARAREEITRLHVTIPDVDAPVRLLSGGQRQAVAVARAVSWAKQLVMMDEPTAALGPEQQEQVLKLIRRVRDSGTPVVLVSHSLQQVMSVADRIAVLRRGELVALLRAAETTADELVGFITGVRAQEGAARA